MRSGVYLDTGRRVEAIDGGEPPAEVTRWAFELRGLLNDGVMVISTDERWVLVPLRRIVSVDVEREVAPAEPAGAHDATTSDEAHEVVT